MIKKKIVFVNPSEQDDLFQNAVQILKIPPLSLAVLMSITPEKYDIQLIDEEIAQCTFDEEADLVAITLMTQQATRAYQIAKRFRAKGAKVILGGIHVSLVSEEAMQYADSILIGEAEALWQTILDDFDNGELKRVYRPLSLTDMALVPPIKRELLEGNYFLDTIQTARGCPHNCNFCSVTRFNGTKYRFREVDDVVDEIRTIARKRFFFVDDTIIGSGKSATRHAAELFDKMKGLGKQWASQVCITIADDRNLLKAAAQSGATAFFIGFESVEEQALRGMDKNVNLRASSRNYKEAIEIIHDHGISVVGGFIFGNDTDTKDTTKRTLDFIHDSKIDGASFTISTPYPGTRLYDRLKKENRLLFTNYPDDWRRYDVKNVVFRPKNMTPDELEDEWLTAYKQVSSLNACLVRSLRAYIETRNLSGTIASFLWTYGFHKWLKRKIEHKRFHEESAKRPLPLQKKSRLQIE